MTGTTLALLLLAHLAGDYLVQSHWMASEKTKAWWPAIAHGVTYAACYLLVTRSPVALTVIGGTHVVIDRYRLARHVVWAKNHLAPRSTWLPWSQCSGTGYPPDVPAWLAVWLMIVADNAIHLGVNVASVMWL